MLDLPNTAVTGISEESWEWVRKLFEEVMSKVFHRFHKKPRDLDLVIFKKKKTNSDEAYHRKIGENQRYRKGCWIGKRKGIHYNSGDTIKSNNWLPVGKNRSLKQWNDITNVLTEKALSPKILNEFIRVLS